MIPENEHVTLGLVLRFVAVLRLLDFRIFAELIPRGILLTDVVRLSAVGQCEMLRVFHERG